MRVTHFVAGAVLFAGLAGCPPNKGPVAPTTATVKDTELPADVPGLIKYADEQYKLSTPESVANSETALKKAYEQDKSYEVLWRLARAYAWLGDEYEDDARVELYSQKGIDFGKLAVAADAARVEGQYFLATTTGQYAYVKKLKAKDLVPQVVEAAKAAVKADEKFDHCGPLRLLGSVYAQAPEPPTSVGDHEEGIKMTARAVQHCAIYPQNHLLYADALRIIDNLDGAEAEYNAVLAAQPAGSWAHRLAKWRKQAEDGKKRVANKRRQKASPERGGF
jgi:hypothetical protein